MLKGFDFSHHQAVIDFKQVFDAGYDFAIGKATEGLTYIDPTFKDRIQRGLDAGLVMGAYHFFHPLQDAIKQAQFFLSQFDPSLPLIVAGDFERIQNDNVAQDDWDKLTKEQISESIQNFMDYLLDNLKRHPLVYVSRGFYDQYLQDMPMAGYGLWLARYEVTVPKVWQDYTIWQYTPGGIIPGVSGAVDLDRFEGSLDDLKKLTVRPTQ